MIQCLTQFVRRPTPRALSRASWLRLTGLALVTVVGTACASLNERSQPVPSLIGSLPRDIASFEYNGYKHFDDGSSGYSFRYSNQGKKRYADVYVYPVADENASLEHKELVLGSTRATINAIDEAVKQGLYANFDLLDAATRSYGLRTTARVQATYLRDNLASFTMLYQSEHQGTLMKIRMSMPDNGSNRTNGEWDAFAERVFQLVVDDIERDEGISGAQASIGRAQGASQTVVDASPAFDTDF